jgi:hypothetical protein
VKIFAAWGWVGFGLILLRAEGGGFTPLLFLLWVG